MAVASTITQEQYDRLAVDFEALLVEKRALEQTVVQLRNELVATLHPVPKPSGPPPVFTVSGRIGGPFSITGRGFGTVQGLLTIAERTIPATAWKDHVIKGVIPADLKGDKDGFVSVNVNGTTVKTKLY